MASKTLYILRHGETFFNLEGRVQGWCDSPLSERGIAQSRRAGRALVARGATFDHAYCSTAERCCDTLEIATAEAYGSPLPYQRMKDLREVSFGSLEGTHNYAEVREIVRTPAFAAVGGGESGAAAQERFERCLDEIMAHDDHHNVLVVTSGGISMQFFLAHFATSALRQRLFSNCLAYVYEWDEGVYRCKDIYVPDLADLEDPKLPTQVKHIIAPPLDAEAPLHSD